MIVETQMIEDKDNSWVSAGDAAKKLIILKQQVNHASFLLSVSRVDQGISCRTIDHLLHYLERTVKLNQDWVEHAESTGLGNLLTDRERLFLTSDRGRH